MNRNLTLGLTDRLASYTDYLDSITLWTDASQVEDVYLLDDKRCFNGDSVWSIQLFRDREDMQALTRKQQQILNFIENYRHENGTAPSNQEIASHFGYRSLNAVAQHKRLMQQKGALVIEPNKARSVRAASPLDKFRKPKLDIPVYGSIPAGFPDDNSQEIEGCVTVDVETLGVKSLLNINLTQRFFALRVRGDSMVGRNICDGDYVLMEHGPEPHNGQIVAAYIDGRDTLKTFIRQKGRVFLRAENSRYPDLIPAEELTIHGVFRLVIGQKR